MKQWTSSLREMKCPAKMDEGFGSMLSRVYVIINILVGSQGQTFSPLSV